MPLLPFLSTEAWSAVPGLLQGCASVGSLALLEAVLSADNAVALAGIVAGVQPAARRRRILNQGLLCAFLLRGLMILAAAWVIRFEAVRVLGGLYLIWLAVRHFQEQFEEPLDGEQAIPVTGSSDLQLLAVIAGTDLAFSIDSVSAAVAVCDNVVLVLIGGALGVAMLRFLAGWVIVWMQHYVDLANAAYLTVLAVGLRMLARSLVPALEPPQGAMLLMMAALFVWGFSRRREAEPLPAQSLAAGAQTLAPATQTVALTAQTVALGLETAASSGSGVCRSPVFTSANTARL
jgi:YkoY family integral membrane protein